MATQLPPPYQGTSPKLPFMAFGAVILVLLFIIGFLVYHSTKPEPLEAEATKKEYALQYAKQYAREHINSLVLVEPLNYTSKPWGGISGLKVAVSNKTSFTIDEVLVEVRYIKSNGGVYTTENIRFNGIKPKHTLTQNASGSNRGVQVETQIVAVRSNELDMN